MEKHCKKRSSVLGMFFNITSKFFIITSAQLHMQCIHFRLKPHAELYMNKTKYLMALL